MTEPTIEELLQRLDEWVNVVDLRHFPDEYRDYQAIRAILEEYGRVQEKLVAYIAELEKQAALDGRESKLTIWGYTLDELKELINEAETARLLSKIQLKVGTGGSNEQRDSDNRSLSLAGGKDSS